MLSSIGNRIIADNQRRMLDKLLRQNMAIFADIRVHRPADHRRHGREPGDAFGRDLMSLLGLSLVMVIQDPVMSLMGFIMAPPALFFLRKLIRRVRSIARMQFTGGTRIIETMQEALQGMRLVKGGLEDEMRRRLAKSVAEVEHEVEQDGARGQPREPADGDARRLYPSRWRRSTAATG